MTHTTAGHDPHWSNMADNDGQDEQTRVSFWVEQTNHFAALYREARSDAENFRRLYEAKTLELARAQKAAEDNEQRAN